MVLNQFAILSYGGNVKVTLCGFADALNAESAWMGGH
jgi:hypothetical protein